jgi:PAS domain S-box-containing protein
MIGTHQDITERKQMEHELRRYSENLEQLVSERTKKLTESEERYRQLLESMSEHIAVLDDEFRYVLANDALTRSIKIPREQLRGKKLTEIFPGVEKSVFFEAGQRVMKSRSSTSVVDAHRFEDGRAGWYECHIYPVPEGIMYVANDITERKRMEEALLKSERMATIGELAAMVGHDLRNPLQGIAGAAYNIRRHLRNAPDPSTKEMLAVIDNGVQYANGIINDLLEFSKEMQLQPVPTTPKSIVRQTMTDLRIPNNITIEDTTADTPEILADEPKLRRVLTNLIENAIDAMPEGGELSISSVNTQQGVSILLSDTGFGIPQNMIEKIWTPLHTTKAKGIGLGLPICRRIMEAHGGSISVESSVGKGTTFTLKLPIQPVQAEVKHYD